MNIIERLLKRKKKITLKVQGPDVWVKVCGRCDYPYWQTAVEGNPFPMTCPRCGVVQEIDR